MPRCLVALGSNVGERWQAIEQAVDLLRAEPAITSLRLSTPHETRPIGGAPNQGLFLNAAVSFDTTLVAPAVHALLHMIESRFGRQRVRRWDARTLDLDLLLYGEQVIDTEALSVPHPRMAWRRFVLEPAVEVASDMRHPIIGWSIVRLLAHLNTAVPYVAIADTGRGRTAALAQRVAALVDGRFLAGPATEGAAGLGYRGQIQLLNRRAQPLDRAAWPPGKVLAVSDFWFDQTLAAARAGLGSGELAAFTEAWQTARAQVVLPKLLVLLDTPPANSSLGSTTTGPAPQADRLRDELLRLAVGDGAGPMLIVGGEPSDPLDEIVAAIQAMQ